MPLADNLFDFWPLTSNTLVGAVNGNVLTPTNMEFEAASPGPCWRRNAPASGFLLSAVKNLVPPFTIAIEAHLPTTGETAIVYYMRGDGNDKQYGLFRSGTNKAAMRTRYGTLVDIVGTPDYEGNGAWGEIAGVWTSATSRALYESGTLGTPDTTNLALGDLNLYQRIVVGAMYDGSTTFLPSPENSRYRNLAIWERALTDAELDSYFANPGQLLPAPAAPVITGPSGAAGAASSTFNIAELATQGPTFTTDIALGVGYPTLSGANAANWQLVQLSSTSWRVDPVTPFNFEAGGLVNPQVFVFNASASVSQSSAGTVTNVNETPTFPGPNISIPTLTQGVAMTPYNAATSFADPDAGDTGTYSAVGTWPAGVTVSSAGVISGTPSAAGTFANLRVRRTDGGGLTVDSNLFPIAVNSSGPNPVITGPSGAAGAASSTFNIAELATQGPTFTTDIALGVGYPTLSGANAANWQLVQLSSTSWRVDPVTPFNFEAGGLVNPQVFVFIASASVSQSSSGTVTNVNETPTFPGPNISIPTLTQGVAMTPYNAASSFADPDAGDTGTYSAVGTWPAGVTVSSAGVISGTPSPAGTFANLRVRRTDGGGLTVDSNLFPIAVNTPGGGTVSVPAAVNWMNQALNGATYPRVVVVSDSPALVAARSNVVAEADGGFAITDPAIVPGQYYSVFPFDLTNDPEAWQRGGWRVLAT